MRVGLRRILMAVAATAVVGAVVWAMLPQPVTVEVAEATRGPMQVRIDEDGKTRIRERYVISAPLTGRLLRIGLDPGDAVRAEATLLAAIEPRDPDLLDPRAQAEGEARVRSAEASLRRAEPALAAAEADAALAASELRRIREARAGGAASQTELDESELLATLKAEEARAAQFALQIAQFELEQAQAALLRTRSDDQAPRSTEPFEIHAPCDGRVLRVFQESAGVVAAGTPLLEIGDPANLELVIDVLSTDAVRISAGARVIVEHWGGEVALIGRVRLVEPAAYTKVSALGVEEQRVDVVIDLVDPHEKWRSLGDGYRVEAAIVTWSAEDVLRVPAGALFRRGERWAVFVVVDGRADLRSVTIGHRTATHAEVLDGLSAGESVVMHPGDRIGAGVAVKAIDLNGDTTDLVD